VLLLAAALIAAHRPADRKPAQTTAADPAVLRGEPA
jgi:hypothetical protein